jgi:hypothetical protein
MKKIIYLSLIIFGCETKITPELEIPAKIMVVDAWINQKTERQEIRITQSQPYFENTLPAKISHALVTVEDLNTGTKYDFQEGPKSYFWDPAAAPIGIVGHNYRLTVNYNGETFEAFSNMGRVPPIDSIKFNYNSKDILVKEEYYKAEFMATDPVGVGDTYWIKTWKNGQYLNKPSELNMAFDAGFTAGQSVDGQVFNIIIRQDFISPLDKIPEQENEFFPPYVVGDSVYVEIHSINHLAFDFLIGLYFQTSRPGGFAELFSTPLANVPTNLKCTDENSSTKVAGFFNVAAVSSAGRKLTQQIADKAK